MHVYSKSLQPTCLAALVSGQAFVLCVLIPDPSLEQESMVTKGVSSVRSPVEYARALENQIIPCLLPMFPVCLNYQLISDVSMRYLLAKNDPSLLLAAP